MSLHNAVHVLLEVAAGRRNLSAAEADQLHDEIDAGQAAPAADEAEDEAAHQAAEGVNLDAPADA